MSHSKIYQISSKPIDENGYASPEMYYDNSDDFADYIGKKYEGKDRDEAIEYLADILKDVFEHKGGGEFRYKGREAMEKFKQAWADELRRLAGLLTPENLFKDHNLYLIRATCKETHLRSSYRVDIDEWCGSIAYPFGELFEYAASQLKAGDRIYVGAVIDYHY